MEEIVTTKLQRGRLLHAAGRSADFLLPRTGQTLEWEFAREGERAEIHFGGPIALNDIEARLQLAEDGLGVVQTVCFLAAPRIAKGKLVRLLSDWETAAPMISILYPRNKYLPARVRTPMDFSAKEIANSLQSARRSIGLEPYRFCAAPAR